MTAAVELTAVARLGAVLERTAAARDERDLERLLDEVARAISDALGWGAVVVNIYRPAFDDLFTATVRGSRESRRRLLHTAVPMPSWTPLLDERFERRGAYLIPDEDLDWDALGVETYVPDLPPPARPNGWRAGDALFVPLRGRDGRLLGTISVDEPRSGRRPSPRELDVLVAMARHAALAIRIAQETAEDAQHQRMLERVLEVSARLAGAGDAEAVLQAVSDGIRDAIGFERVAISLAEEPGGELAPVATSGWEEDAPALRHGVTLHALAPLFTAEFEIAGCYLLPHEAAEAVLGPDPVPYRSEMNGSGPHAWSRHWLLVPLADRSGERFGVIWADDPRDRLLPTRARLQALRLFANQAVAALRSADRVVRLRHEATHDPLTGLANRRAFLKRVSQEAAAADRRGRSFALVLCDMDGLKAINDTHGHAAGDQALCLLADVLRDGLRRSDEAFRLGGDEFAVVLAEATREDAERVVERLRRALESRGAPPAGTVEACFGIGLRLPGESTERLFAQADQDLYLAKRVRAGSAVQ